MKALTSAHIGHFYPSDPPNFAVPVNGIDFGIRFLNFKLLQS